MITRKTQSRKLNVQYSQYIIRVECECISNIYTAFTSPVITVLYDSQVNVRLLYNLWQLSRGFPQQIHHLCNMNIILVKHSIVLSDGVKLILWEERTNHWLSWGPVSVLKLQIKTKNTDLAGYLWTAVQFFLHPQYRIHPDEVPV